MPGPLRNLLENLNLFGLATSDAVSVTVAPPPPPPEELLTISADKTSIVAGESVTFSGQYTLDGKGQVYKPLTLYINGAASMDMDTDSSGYYSISWTPGAAGTYSIYAKSG